MGNLRRDSVAGAFDYMETLPVLQDHVICRQVSSYDRKGGNDNGFTNKAEWIRGEGGRRVVLLDVAGPGCVRNLAYSWPNQPILPDTIERSWARLLGEIGFDFGDGQAPGIRAPVRSLIGTPPHTYPLGLTADESAGSYVSYVPMPFQDGLKVAVDRGRIPMFFYRIWYHCYPLGTHVPTSSAAPDVTQIAGHFDPELAWEPAGPLVRELTDVSVPAGESREVFEVDVGGTIRCLRMQLPEDEAMLRNLWLRAFWDEDVDPSIDAPVSLLFAAENRYSRKPAAVETKADMRGLVAGQDPHGFFYLRLPMPYLGRARLVLENRGDRDVTVHAIRVEATDVIVPGLGRSAGYLRTQFRESSALTPARDYVLAELRGRGHIVGTILAVEDTSETFLEGDERVCTDGCRTPLVIGDATETYFNGSWYFWDRAFACPLHGAPTFRMRRKRAGGSCDVTMYRFHLTDWIPYRNAARFTIQHGPFNDVPGRYRSLVFYYGLPAPSLVGTDAVKLADADDLAAHDCSGTPARTWTRTGFFVGELNGQDLGLRPRPRWMDPMLAVLFRTVRGIFHDSPQDSADRVRFTMSVYRGAHEFGVKVDPAASAVMLRRVFDQSIADQRARIEVDGVHAGTWFNAGRNKWKIFAEDDLILDPAETAGKSELRIRVVPESPEFTVSEYAVFSIVVPERAPSL